MGNIQQRSKSFSATTTSLTVSVKAAAGATTTPKLSALRIDFPKPVNDPRSPFTVGEQRKTMRAGSALARA